MQAGQPFLSRVCVCVCVCACVRVCVCVLGLKPLLPLLLSFPLIDL